MSYIVKFLIAFIVLFINVNDTAAQVIDPVKWEFSSKMVGKNEAVVYLKAMVDDTWHIYGQSPNGGFNPTTFTFEPSEDYELVGLVKDPDNFIRKKDEIMDTTYNLYSKVAIFEQRIKIKTQGKPVVVQGNVNFFSCDDERCLPPKDEEFSITIEKKEKKSLIGLFILSFLGGLGALLTPCVFPIIPLTVSFFMRGTDGRKGKSVMTGLIFGLSIILIYTMLGLIVGITGVDLTGPVARSWLANAIFAAIFIIFGLSFYGLFEIVLPSRWSNSVDSIADKGGLLGTFFMALATVLISFSCTGPIVGGLILKSLEGELIQPIVGMFAFSLAFALPFPLLALFPDMIKKMPKSGGWLNSVKVFFAFIMIGFSLKFIQNIDKLLHWNIITRDLFISIWMILSILLGLYFLGIIKFSHDSDLKHVSVFRFFLSLASFVFAAMMFTGLMGAELKGLSSMLPERKVENKIISQVNSPMFNDDMNDAGFPSFDYNTASDCGLVKYDDFLDLPLGLTGFFDVEEGIACAKQQNKPVLLDFKGHVCTNCKAMENMVWSDPEVLKKLKEDFVIIGLFTDDLTKLPEEEWYENKKGKILKKLGQQNLDYQIEKYGTNTIPYYVLIDHEGNKLAEPKGYDPDIKAFLAFLDEGLENFKN